MRRVVVSVVRDGNRVQDSCNRLNWGALDHASRAPQLSLLQLPHIPLLTKLWWVNTDSQLLGYPHRKINVCTKSLNYHIYKFNV